MIIATPGRRRYADSAGIVIRYIEAVRNGDTHAIADVVATDATWDYPGDLTMSGTWRAGAGGHDNEQRRRPGARPFPGRPAGCAAPGCHHRAGYAG